MPDDEALPVVEVRVMVNVDGLRRGEEGEVELTPRIQQLVRSGYMRILGHVLPGAPEPAPPATVANPARTRAKRARVVDDGAADGDPAGPERGRP